MVVSCLSASAQPIVWRLVRLHTAVMMCFVVGVLFNTASATPDQTFFEDGGSLLHFDDIDTSTGWGILTEPYHGLIFEGFYPFKPSHPRFEGLISEHDLNCAVSKPNALHGSRYNIDSSIRPMHGHEEPTRLPSITSNDGDTSLNLYSFSVKPLNFPINSVTFNLRGTVAVGPASPSDGAIKSDLIWRVDFPAGYHEVLNVSLRDYSHRRWNNLSRIELWADFNNADITMDWEFCIDDLELDFNRP
ncbi:uncharacterized protein A1O9_05402 [Exophiala aquamarina CBS 119918]|uniref:Uncharacterized protein n=1 Tax=Exophiala aquamarina CBS 119918 TaxID=1182545 RepID=A0A072PPN9_9EURO|nr:uncharacterized protein A1O9_05402 [Exophiala aquamarina CBS 119918]KEF57485.1 hypothetical protein A1O9_05402 [Exophiala aquamarina CBS 119918]